MFASQQFSDTDLVEHPADPYAKLYLSFIQDKVKIEFIEYWFPAIYKEIAVHLKNLPLLEQRTFWNCECDTANEFLWINHIAWLCHSAPDEYPPDITSWDENTITEADEAFAEDTDYNEQEIMKDCIRLCDFFHLPYRETIQYDYLTDTTWYQNHNLAIKGVW